MTFSDDKSNIANFEIKKFQPIQVRMNEKSRTEDDTHMSREHHKRTEAFFSFLFSFLIFDNMGCHSVYCNMRGKERVEYGSLQYAQI